MKRMILSLVLCLMLALSCINVSAAEMIGGDVFEASRSVVVITIPEEYKSLKGTIEYSDFGDEYSDGKGVVEILATYYPLDAQELDRRLDEEAEAESRSDIDESEKLFNEMHPANLFRIIGLSESCGADSLVEWYLAALDPEKAETEGITRTEEEIEEEKKLILSNQYTEIGTCEGITYTLVTKDPEKLKSREPYKGYEDGYYEEFISLIENADKLLENIQLTGGVEFTVLKELAESGKAVQFEATDLDGNSIDSKELFTGHPVTMINLWATWCGPCINELPDLEKLNQELSQNNCQIIGIVYDANNDEKVSKAKEILAEKGVSYVNLASFEGLPELLPQNSLPTSYFVDENGCLLGEPIVGKYLEKYQKRIEELLKSE